MKDVRRLIPVLSALALIAGGYWLWQRFQTEVPPTNRPAVAGNHDVVVYPANAPQLAFLNISPVESEPVPLIEPLNAHIAYDDNLTARVSAPIAGRVLRILKEPGDRVKKGEVLAEIDAPDFALAVSDSQKAEADLLRKQQAFERAKLLWEAKSIAQKDVELAEADQRLAEAESKRARERLENLGGAHNSGHYLLRAPLAGTVTERQISSGSEVRPDAPQPLFVITDPLHLWVQVDLPERELGKVEVGQAAIVEVDAYPGEAFLAHITVIAGALDPATRRVQMRCEVVNEEGRLKPEMYARMTPIARERDRLPRVPNAALITEGLYSFLFVETAPGVLQKRRVDLALRGHEFSYVKSGLKEGERVVTSGALLLNSELGNQ
ncbi:efflux RND transporter periplasmic adaptor subunit [Ferriphaselus sp. R-1]|uniref:efflux RND transporter periplasmic adaptor subunit n=1 Tax=Ferriphaselus sp. R-1 TaxID=1485544 RepID=UPI0005525BDE|nr:efflux RND transporter periplasmic adaptor subunit [Ferriphaselus sp. R-1]